MHAILTDPSFWVTVALALFLFGLFRANVQGAVAKALDDRAAEIKAKLDAAEALRVEAETLVKTYRDKRDAAAAEAEAIVANARAEAERLAVEAKQALDDTVKRRTEMAMAKIAQAEAQALADVRGAVADVAIAAAGRLIADRLDEGRAGALVDAGIQAVATKLH